MKKHLISILVLFLFILSTSFVGISNQQQSVDTDTPETLTGGGLMNSSWPMFHHDTWHTGRSPYGPTGYLPSIKWKFQMEGQTISSPAIDENNIVYIGAEEF